MDDQRFVSSVETLNDRVHRFTIAHRGSDGACGATLRWEEVIELWRTDGAFARFFTMMLAACTHESFFWECPPVSSATLAAPFECVAVRAHGFARASPADFEEHFRGDAGAATFTNLGGDAILVAPTGEPVLAPGAARASYGHIAAFVRGAPESQHAAVWEGVGAALASHTSSATGSRPVWLSTEGSGVPWLHVRLDSRPKYYHHRAYAAVA